MVTHSLTMVDHGFSEPGSKSMVQTIVDHGQLWFTMLSQILLYCKHGLTMVDHGLVNHAQKAWYKTMVD
jgi:hypothetical protein